MLNFLPGPLLGSIAFMMYLVNTLFWMIPIFLMTLLKLMIPISPWRKFCNILIDGSATNWISVNCFHQRLTNKTRMEVQGLEGLSLNDWYLVLSNHQSWVDILVLQKVFNRKIPFLKFFVKKELLWVPIMGMIWWALDYPFMKRYSSEFIAKNPHLKGKDIEITKKACEKFRTIPVSVMTFAEGTRFTVQKHLRQKSPYKNLLKPKAGGTAFILASMGDQLHKILNVTIVYPQGIKTFWQFLCGKVSEIRVKVESLPIPKELLGDYFNDSEFREYFQNWLNTLWVEKDRCFEAMIGQGNVR